MSILISLWAWLQTRVATARRDEGGWGAVEWMVIMVSVVALAYAANVGARTYLDIKVEELLSSG